MRKSKVVTCSLVLDEFVADAGGQARLKRDQQNTTGVKRLVQNLAVEMGFSRPRAAEISEKMAAVLGPVFKDRVRKELRAIQKKEQRRQ
jgi:hypothetical protein